jgi:DNA-binding transcriptional regulator YiaG
MKPVYRAGSPWDSGSIRALRQHLGLTQNEMSARLGTRQQTISEWETGMYQPRGTSSKLLSMIAEQAKFKYDAGSDRTGS